jgi:two-component sensor histidine kinase/PAS domain-containing protein
MQGLQFVSFLFLIYSASFFLIYLTEALHERLRSPAKYRDALGGFLLGVVVLAVQLVIRAVNDPDMPPSIPDGRFLLIFVSLIYYGARGGTVTLLAIWAVSLALGYRPLVFLAVNGLVDYATGLIFLHWMKGLKIKHHLPAVLLGTAIIQIAALGTVSLLMNVPGAKENYFRSFPYIFFILELYSLSIALIFVSNRKSRERIEKLKEAEDGLGHKTALLEAQLNSSSDGVLVVDSRGKKILQNRSMIEMWGIPRHISDSDDDATQIRHVMNMTKDPGKFLEKITYLYDHPEETSRDEVSLAGGTVLDRYSAPVIGEDGRYYGRIWSFHDITERKRAEEDVLRSLREKETLIRELYHRTKNTMQVIRGLIVLQGVEYPDNAELQRLVKNTGERIQAISLVHQMLYQSKNLSRVSIKDYIGDLSALILTSYANTDSRISVSMDVEDQYYLLDAAIPLGLIINELMTNSLKYAFPDGRKGKISIALEKKGAETSLLRYSDDGVGVPDGFDFRDRGSLGMRLIFSIAEQQMLGSVKFGNEGGVSCSIEISTDLYKARI